MLALLKYDKGMIRIFGQEMAPDNYQVKKDMGIVLQNVAVFDELTVYENIDYFCGLYVKNKIRRKELVDEAIRFVGLEEHRKNETAETFRRTFKKAEYCLRDRAQTETYLYGRAYGGGGSPEQKQNTGRESWN